MSRDPSSFERQFSIEGASALFRKSQLMSKVAERVRLLDKSRAYRVGIGPLEYDAIIAANLSAVETSRLEALIDRLSEE